MIRVDSLRHAYEGREVLALDRLVLGAGEALLVTGPLGTGKTTLPHLLAGLLVPTSGRIEIAGTEISALPGAARDRFRGRSIGIVLQQFHLLATLTALQKLLVAKQRRRSRRQGARARNARVARRRRSGARVPERALDRAGAASSRPPARS